MAITGTLTKGQAIEKIKGHIVGCKKSKKEYLKAEEWNAVKDMQSRIDGLELALEYVREIIDKPMTKAKLVRGQI